MNGSLPNQKRHKPKVLEAHEVTKLRYMLFYNDDLVSDSFKLKSKITFTSAEENVFDMQLITSHRFQQKLK